MGMTPYLFFDGRCEEAVDFYKAKLGAEVETIMRFADAPGGSHPPIAPGLENKVMHAAFRIGAAHVMASDGMCSGKNAPSFSGFSLSLEVPDKAAAEKTFAALGEGGAVQQPLTETFFSPAFGMVADKFGVSWMVLVPGQQP